MMGHRHQQQQQQQQHSPTDANGSSGVVVAGRTTSPLDAFNVSMMTARPAKAKSDFGLRQFGDVIGRAKSTLNVIDVWKSKLVSASASARQLASPSAAAAAAAAGEHRGLGSGFGSKNKNKSVAASSSSSPPPPPASTSPPIGAGAKNEISTGFSSAAAASRIKRRLFRRNKSLDFDAVVPAATSVAVDSNKSVVVSDTAGVLCKSVDNILSALVSAEGGEAKCSDQVFRNKGRRRSSVTALFPINNDRRTTTATATPQQQQPKRRRRRCYSYQDGEHEEEDEDVEEIVNRVTKKHQLDRDTRTSSGEDEEEDSGYKLGRENIVLNNKLGSSSSSYCERGRASSKRSLGTKEQQQQQRDHGFPILLLDKDFDLDDFYYYYWKRKLLSASSPSEDIVASSHRKQRRHRDRDRESGSSEPKGIRATLKLNTLSTEQQQIRANCGLGQRRLSDPTLATVTESRIVEELLSDTTTTRTTTPTNSSTHTVNMLTEDESTSSTATNISALGIPTTMTTKTGKPRKKLSFKEPDGGGGGSRSRGKGGGGIDDNNGVGDSYSYFRPRTGSLDSELEVLLLLLVWKWRTWQVMGVCFCSVNWILNTRSRVMDGDSNLSNRECTFTPPFAVSGDEDREDGGAGVRGVP